MTDESAQLDLVVAALDAAGAFPHTLGDLARLSVPPNYYTEVTVTRRFGGEQRNGGGAGTTGWRITTRAVAKTEGNAREMRRRAGLIERTTVGDSTPVAFEGADPIAPDDGWYSGLSTWTYVT